MHLAVQNGEYIFFDTINLLIYFSNDDISSFSLTLCMYKTWFDIKVVFLSSAKGSRSVK